LRVQDVLKQTGDLSGKVVITCSLPMKAQNTELVLGHTTSGAEELAKMMPGAQVVCALNAVPSEVLFGVYDDTSGRFSDVSDISLDQRPT
jgi:predicted dinucleotide-binding enzyme